MLFILYCNSIEGKKLRRKPKILKNDFAFLTLLLFLFTFPLWVRGYWLYFFTLILIWGLFASGFNIIYGYTGLLHFGMSVFLGIGSYVVIIAINYLNASLCLIFLLLLAVAVVVPFLLGLLILRFKSHTFVILTIIISMIFFTLAMSMRWLTGGDEGLAITVPDINLLNLKLSFLNRITAYYFVLIVVGFFIYLIKRIIGSPLGKAFNGIKYNEELMRTIGYNVSRIKLVSLTIGGFLGCIAGGLYVLVEGYGSANLFFWLYSGYAVIWTVIGGAGTIIGPFIGVALLSYTEDIVSAWAPYIWLIIVGLVIIITILLAPHGIAGYIEKRIYRKKREV